MLYDCLKLYIFKCKKKTIIKSALFKCKQQMRAWQKITFQKHLFMFYLFINHAKCMPQCISVLEKGFVLLCFFVFRFHFHLSRYFVNIFKLTELCISYVNSLTLCSLLHYLVPIFSQLQTIYSITLTIVLDICTLHSFEISLQQYIRSFMWFWNVL